MSFCTKHVEWSVDQQARVFLRNGRDLCTAACDAMLEHYVLVCQLANCILMG